MTNSVFDPQLVSGAAILLSFFVGYKYALRCNTKPDAKDLVDDPSPSTSKAAGDGSEGRVSRIAETYEQFICWLLF